MTPEEIKNKLSLGRIMAMNNMPYFAKLLLSLKPVPSPGLGTFAVDTFWRMYYDPKCVEEWTIEEISAVWLHEIGHIYRDHAHRFETTGAENAKAWNAAADAVINTDLKEMNIILPSHEKRYYVTSDIFEGAEKGVSTEELYEKAKRKITVNKVKTPEGVNVIAGKPSEENDQEDEEYDVVDGYDGDSGESVDAEIEEDLPSTESEDGQGSGDSSSSDSTSDSSKGGNEHGDPSHEGNPEESGDYSDSNDHDSDSDGGCGSAVDSQPRDYEIPYDDEENPGVSPQEAAKVVTDTAQEIDAYEKSRPGSVPGGIIRETAEILNPIVDWKNSLKVRVRREIGIGMAKTRNSYKRISRRGAALGKGIIIPGKSGDEEVIMYIVLDTSGSMTEKELTLGVSEIVGLLKKIRGKVYFIAVDSKASEPVLINNVEDLVLEGGGGTDMGIGIKAAAECIPKPDIILTITDGGTPWIDKPPKEAPKVKYLAVIVLRRKDYKGPGDKPPEVARVPKFIETIVAYV